MLKSFVLQLYGSRHKTLVNDRFGKFKTSTDNDLRLLPPSKEVIHQHIYRVSYLADYSWRQSAEEIDILDPEQ